jgi:ATP-binding cassette subfamily B protein
MFSLMDEEQEIQDEPGAMPLKVNGGEVEFRTVSFAYDQRTPILKDVSFKVPSGHMVAIVGSTGAGKRFARTFR